MRVVHLLSVKHCDWQHARPSAMRQCTEACQRLCQQFGNHHILRVGASSEYARKGTSSGEHSNSKRLLRWQQPYKLLIVTWRNVCTPQECPAAPAIGLRPLHLFKHVLITIENRTCPRKASTTERKQFIHASLRRHSLNEADSVQDPCTAILMHGLTSDLAQANTAPSHVDI